MKINILPHFAILLLLIVACKEETKVDPLSLPAFGEKGVNVVIEIPAGTNRQSRFNKNTGTFDLNPGNDPGAMIDFLPYPGNYGFIPSTALHGFSEDDGQTLKALVITESLPAGTVLEIIPVAALLLEDDGKDDIKIIGVPVDTAQRIIRATDFEHFLIEYNMAHNIIQDWFLSYKGLGKVQLKRWQDEKHAMEMIRKSVIKVE